MFKRSSVRPASIGYRLQAATGAAIVTIGLLLCAAYVVEGRRVEQTRIELLVSVTETATGIAAYYDGAARAGSMPMDEARRLAAIAIGAIRYRGGEYLWINDTHPRMIMHPIKPSLNGQDLTAMADPAGKHLFVEMADIARTQGSGTVAYLWPRQGSDTPQPKLSYVTLFEPWGWVIGTGVYMDDIVRERHTLALTMVAVGTVLCTVLGLLLWRVGRSVTRPLDALTRSTVRLSGGDFDVAIPGTGRRDELGLLARALEMLQQGSRDRIRLEADAAGERAAQGRRQAAMDRYTADFGSTISAALTRLGEAAATMRGTADQMSGATARTRSSAASTSADSSNASRDLGTVAAATVELSASVDEIGCQVAHSTQATQDAVARAADTIATFDSMATMAARIQEVGRVIAEIAGQTNLLALNATIEAARAGEAGKGFAVVASEVKALAGKTAAATAEIGQEVQAIQQATEQTAAAIRLVSAAIGRVDEVSAAIAAAVEQQGATTREIAQSVQAIATSGERTSSAIAEVAAISNDSEVMSQGVLAASTEIGAVAGTLRAEVDHFLTIMSQEESQRRRYERVPVQRALATLAADGQQVRVSVIDISRGGAAVEGAGVLEPGVMIALLVPGAPGQLAGRIVRCAEGTAGIAFIQDGANLDRVDAAVAVLTAGDANQPPALRLAA